MLSDKNSGKHQPFEYDLEICPACEFKRLHTESEWKQYHPLAGHGYSGEHGQRIWTCLEAERLHKVEKLSNERKRNMNTYIAHNFNARLWLREKVVPLLEQSGHLVTSTWITDDSHVLEDNAEKLAFIDLSDIDRASNLILFVDQFDDRPGKGKFVELGYALRAGKRIILVGTDNSCVFYNLPNIRRAKTIEEAICLL